MKIIEFRNLFTLFTMLTWAISSQAQNTAAQLDITPVYGTSMAAVITGPQSTILIDAQLSNQDALTLNQLIRETAKPLTAIYITHAHPDHVLGLDVLLSEFPDARLLAIPSVAEEIRNLYASWRQQFGARLDLNLEMPELNFETVTNAIEVDGVSVEIITGLQGDTPDSTAVWIPSESTLVAGDILFNQVHLLFTAQRTSEGRETWLSSLDRLESYDAETVIAGHTKVGLAFDGSAIDFTREYIEAFEQAVSASSSADEVIQVMSVQYPDSELAFLLGASAAAVMGGQP